MSVVSRKRNPSASTVQVRSAITGSTNDTPEPIKGHKPKIKLPARTLPEWVAASKPSKGLRLLVWWIYQSLRLYKLTWVPVPRYNGLYGLRATENAKFVRENTKDLKTIITVISSKGGSLKTTIITWLAAFWSTYTVGFCVLFDFDTSMNRSAPGRLGLMATDGISLRTLTQEVVKGRQRPTYRALHNAIAWHRESMLGLVPMPDDPELTPDETTRLINQVAPSVHTIFADTTPGFKEPNTNGVVEVARIRIITGKYTSEDDMRSIMSTLEHERFGLRGQLDTVLISVGAVPWLHYNLRTVYALAEQFGVNPKQVVLLPNARHVKKAGVVMFSAIGPKYTFANSELARRAADIALAQNTGGPESETSTLYTPSHGAAEGHNHSDTPVSDDA